MSEKMTETGDDLSAVAWVYEELRRSLDAAHKALRRFGKEIESAGGSDIDAVDPAVLRGARAHRRSFGGPRGPRMDRRGRRARSAPDGRT